MTTVEVYNAAGQKVDTLLNANLSSGSHSVTWDAAKHSAGVYFYTVRSGDFSRTMKMTLLK
jgi:flagellar hook assembly protein FlgD